METDKHETPQKVKSVMMCTKLRSNVKCDSSNSATTTPRYKKNLHPRTPSGSNCSNVAANSSSSFYVLPPLLVSTPPAKRFHVRNPFEAALADRLHLPLIASPSLFQRPNTPQLSSTQFEWTIEDVSSLQPANVEPHETQFQDTLDPEYEAKAQSAISSYFKEQQIVPSPVDCPLRRQRIIFSEINGNTPIAKPGRRIRDMGTQTELTLPVNLPKELEEALRPYLQPQLACSEESQMLDCESSLKGCSTPTDVKDVSLRRKLFDMHNIVVLDDNKSPPSALCEAMVHLNNSNRNSNSSPLSVTTLQRQTAIIGKLSDSLDKSSFDSLSPITAKVNLSISPNSPAQGSSSKIDKSRLHKYLHDLDAEVEQLSPIHPPVYNGFSKLKKKAETIKENYRIHMNSTDGEQTFNDLLSIGQCDKQKFTPDRSSSPLRCLESTELTTIDNSFNVKVSRLMVNSSKVGSNIIQNKITKTPINDMDLFENTTTDETLDDDDDMQVSQMSMQSSNCSSSNSDTPRSKRRSASRKNLSQSFNASHWLNREDDDDTENDDINLKDTENNCNSSFNKSNIFKSKGYISEELKFNNGAFTCGDVATSNNTNVVPIDEQRCTFYRTDSGFNDMTSSCFSSHSPFQQITEKRTSTEPYQNNFVDTLIEPQDVSMTYCSTPTAKCTDFPSLQQSSGSSANAPTL